MGFRIRRVLLEFGSSISPWLAHGGSLRSMHEVVKVLRESSTSTHEGKFMVSPDTIQHIFHIDAIQTRILVALLAAVVPEASSVQLSHENAVLCADVYALILLMVVHIFDQEQQKQGTADVWPSTHFHATPAPASSVQKQEANNPTSSQLSMAEYLWHQEARLSHFPRFLGKNAESVLRCVLDDPAGSIAAGDFISTVEFDRLSMILEYVPNASSLCEENIIPMDVCNSGSAVPEVPRLSAYASDLFPTVDTNSVTLKRAAEWFVESTIGVVQSHDDTYHDAAFPMALSPPRGTAGMVFHDSSPGQTMIRPTDITNVSKNTIVKGDDFLEEDASIIQCFDTVIYLLAPLKYVKVTCCSDCVIILGAVGRCLRIEHCERIQVIAAARQIILDTCHDCTIYSGVNVPPLLLGDNRFVQLAPYNAGYGKLEAHMALAGVTPAPNYWDTPLTLTPSSTDSMPTPINPKPPGDMCVSLMPPEALMPCCIPFLGGEGFMAGGPSSTSPTSIDKDKDSLSLFMSMGAAEGCAFSKSPFPLPSAYTSAWRAKMLGISEVRLAVKSANLDDVKKKEIMTAIQSHFKEWLHATGKMGEVYHLAKAEKERARCTGPGMQQQGAVDD